VSNLADYIIGLLMFNVFLVVIVLGVVAFINAKIKKQQKEISFMYVRSQRAKKIEDMREERERKVTEKEKKSRRRQ